jgi:hypothetical protein
MDDLLSSIVDLDHTHGESREIQMQQYQIASSIAEEEIRQRGFEVISRDDRFIDRPATERPAG